MSLHPVGKKYLGSSCRHQKVVSKDRNIKQFIRIALCSLSSVLYNSRMLRYTTGYTFTYAAVEQVCYFLADTRVTVQVLIRPVGLSRRTVGSSAAT